MAEIYDTSLYWLVDGKDLLLVDADGNAVSSDTTVKVFYYGYPASDLAADSDSPAEIPVQYHIALVYMAAIEFALRAGLGGEILAFLVAERRRFIKAARAETSKYAGGLELNLFDY